MKSLKKWCSTVEESLSKVILPVFRVPFMGKILLELAGIA